MYVSFKVLFSYFVNGSRAIPDDQDYINRKLVKLGSFGDTLRSDFGPNNDTQVFYFISDVRNDRRIINLALLSYNLFPRGMNIDYNDLLAPKNMSSQWQALSKDACLWHMLSAKEGESKSSSMISDGVWLLPTHAPTNARTNVPTYSPAHAPRHIPARESTHVPTQVPTHAPPTQFITQTTHKYTSTYPIYTTTNPSTLTSRLINVSTSPPSLHANDSIIRSGYSATLSYIHSMNKYSEFVMLHGSNGSLKLISAYGFVVVLLLMCLWMKKRRANMTYKQRAKLLALKRQQQGNNKAKGNDKDTEKKK